MKHRMISLIFIPLLMHLFCSLVTSSLRSAKTYEETRKLLLAVDSQRINSDKLAVLFRVGDKRVQDLICALDDPDHVISLRAQVIIRYLGNPKGIEALRKWYSKQDQYLVAGPTPLPLSDWDFQVIDTNLIGKPPQLLQQRNVQYVYALALDESQEAKSRLDKLIKSGEEVDESTFVGYAIKRVQTERPRKLLVDKGSLARMVLENAFFISTQDQKQASAQLLGLNGSKNKALVEIHIYRGQLAEEWYHVVINKSEEGWRFFSISLISVS